MSGDDVDAILLENCPQHGTFYAEGERCCECEIARLKAANERLERHLKRQALLAFEGHQADLDRICKLEAALRAIRDLALQPVFSPTHNLGDAYRRAAAALEGGASEQG